MKDTGRVFALIVLASITGGAWLVWDWRAAVLAFGLTLLVQERWQ
jgi:hypothetical protein